LLHSEQQCKENKATQVKKSKLGERKILTFQQQSLMRESG